jgi:hypothetical protein
MSRIWHGPNSGRSCDRFGNLVFRSRTVCEIMTGGCGSDHGRITTRPGKPVFRPAPRSIQVLREFGGSLRTCGYRLICETLPLVTAHQPCAQMLNVFGIMQISDLCNDRACRRKRRNAQLFSDHADPMIVVPDSVDPSFIEREQGQKMPNQLFAVGIEAQRMTGEQDRIVVSGHKAPDDGRRSSPTG